MTGTQQQGARRLVIALSGGLGDCLLMSPFVRHFGQSGRYDRILCAVPQAATQLYDRNPYVQQLIPCQSADLWLWALPEADSDVFSPYVSVQMPSAEGFPRNLRPAKLLAPNLADVPLVRQVAHLHGIALKDDSLEMFTEAEDEAWAQEQMAELRDRPCVLLNRATALPEKLYPQRLWEQVVQLLLPHAHMLEFDSATGALPGTHPIAPMPALRRSAALVRRCQCVLTVDSFVSHLAASVRTPAVVLFGPSNPLTFGHRSAVNIRSADCPLCADTPRLRSCTNRVCMERIAPQAVAQAVLDRIA